MDISEFAERFRSVLTDKGVPAGVADDYIKKLTADISKEDTENITDGELVSMAESCAEILLKKSSAEAEGGDMAVVDIEIPFEPEDDDEPESGGDVYESISQNGESEKNRAVQNDEAGATESDAVVYSENSEGVYGNLGGADHTENIAEVERDRESDPISPAENGDDGIPEDESEGETRSIAMLVLVSVLTSPIWLICAALFMLPFALMYAVEGALTAAFILLLAGGSAAGAAASLTGIVYGIVKLFSERSVGVYEIGFGVIIAGVTMIAGILFYNGAVRFMPWLFRYSGKLFIAAAEKVKPLLSKYRRWCEKL